MQTEPIVVAVEVKRLPVPPTPFRVTIKDLSELGGKIASRLQARYPAKSEAVLLGWMRGCTESNQILFIRSGEAVGMFRYMQDFLEPPWIEEVFVLATPEWLDNAAALYSDAAVWGTRQGASKFLVERCTDVDRADISMEIGTPKRVPHSTIMLPIPPLRPVAKE